MSKTNLGGIEVRSWAQAAKGKRRMEKGKGWYGQPPDTPFALFPLWVNDFQRRTRFTDARGGYSSSPPSSSPPPPPAPPAAAPPPPAAPPAADSPSRPSRI